MSDQSMQTIPRLVFTVLVFISLCSCSPSTHKLDEAFIYKGSQFETKLVRYYEKIPLHYNGEIFNVQCSSANTAHSPGSERQDAGWVTLGGGGAIGSKNAGQLIIDQRWNYLTVDEQTLVWVGTGFNVSFDACGHFQSWYPTSLPTGMIDPIEKPDYCQPQGSADCRNYDFQGERTPSFEQIQVDPKQGHITFVVRSKAFKNRNGLRVQSTDFGKMWQIENL